MIEIARMKAVKVFRVLDRDGRPIGRVVQPTSAPIVGRGARTVLLLREQTGDDLRGKACA
jgi:hypothetical protein